MALPRSVLILAAACGLSACDRPAAPVAESRAGGAASTGARAEQPREWKVVAPGLEVGRFAAPDGSGADDATITVVRVDPRRYRFRLLSAKLQGIDPAPTIAEWVERQRVTGAINASMYQADHKTSVGYMREGRQVNNRGWTRDKAVFAAEPNAGGLPAAQILDSTCQDARGLSRRYGLVVQSIRMLDCRGRNVWQPQPDRASTATIGTDAGGRVLLIHCRKPVPTHALVQALLALPLEVRRLMYVEGGVEAALHVVVDGREVVSEPGSYSEGGLLAAAARVFLPLPNALAFAPR